MNSWRPLPDHRHTTAAHAHWSVFSIWELDLVKHSDSLKEIVKFGVLNRKIQSQRTLKGIYKGYSTLWMTIGHKISWIIHLRAEKRRQDWRQSHLGRKLCSNFDRRPVSPSAAIYIVYRLYKIDWDMFYWISTIELAGICMFRQQERWQVFGCFYIRGPFCSKYYDDVTGCRPAKMAAPIM